MSIVCEEIFDEASHPSVDEIRDYAVKIGINPDSEPQLLPIASEGLMKALPPSWKPCFDEKSKSYYYYNQITKQTQWEHPLDDIYRTLVKKARSESQSYSLNEPQTEDATYAKDEELKSYEESVHVGNAPQKFHSLLFGVKKKEMVKLAPLKRSPLSSPKHESKLMKQRSEDISLGNNKLLQKFSSFDEDITPFNRHFRNTEKLELKVTGGGSMFLKSNTKKNDSINTPSPKVDTIDSLPKSILRDKNMVEAMKNGDNDKGSLIDKSEKDDEDRKSVRFNLDNTTDVGITFSDKSSSEEEMSHENEAKQTYLKAGDGLNGKAIKNKTSAGIEHVTTPPLKLIKAPDFLKPSLALNRGKDGNKNSDNSKQTDMKSLNDLFDDDSFSSPDECLKSKLETKADENINKIKQKLWEDKNEELLTYRLNIEESHKQELDRILEEEKEKQQVTINTEINNLKIDYEAKAEREKLHYDNELNKLKNDLMKKFEDEKKMIIEQYENKKEELDKYYEEKLVEIEKQLDEKVKKRKDELNFNHDSDIDQLRQNHSIIIDEIKRGFVIEERAIKEEHQSQMLELKCKHQAEKETISSKPVLDERQFEKLRCEKRLLEDKYRCLKEKYIRLKTDVKLSIEKKIRKKEQSSLNTTATNTTGSETEQSYSNHKEKLSFDSPSRKLIDKPPSHKNQSTKSNSKPIKPVLIQELDTSASDNCYQSDEVQNGLSSNVSSPGRSRRKLFSRLKSSSVSRINTNSSKSKRSHQRACSPVENLRKQLQKLEDLEDQFPQNAQNETTYHLRYPFSDSQKYEGSTELEFFRHRIHLERDSIKRAKETLRCQKALFYQKQNDLKLKHGATAKNTLQQLCQEEKDLTDMEVNLHRTRSLLGEKVIRLRHLQQSLSRANTQNCQNKSQNDATLSDISSHSESSSIGSFEIVGAESLNLIKPNAKKEIQQSTEIIQNLESLNLEIREIWEILRKNQQAGFPQVMPPLVYPDLGWPVLAAAAAGNNAGVPAPPSIPTLADRLHNYRQHVALANAQSTIVTHASQGATTTLIERTRNLRHWLKQNGTEIVTETVPSQTNL